MGQIYKITITKPSGEIFNYIGKSTLTSEIRFKGHLNGEQLVDRYIRKYGLAATTLTTLVYGVETEEELNDLEQYYINKFQSYKPWGYNGLNLSLGGEGVRKYDVSKEELEPLINEGLSDTEICVRLGGISTFTLKNLKITYNLKTKSLFEINEAIIRRMVAEGAHIGEISTATGIASNKLSKALKSAGLKAARKPLVKVTSEMKDQVKSLTVEGKSLYQIERATGIHFMTVQNIQKKLGMKSTAKFGRGTAVTVELIQQVEALRAEGKSQLAISRELGCSQPTVSNILKGKYSRIN